MPKVNILKPFQPSHIQAELELVRQCESELSAADADAEVKAIRARIAENDQIEQAARARLADATSRKGGILLRHHLRRMNEAGLVRVRNTKPAPHYAIPIDSLDKTINTIDSHQEQGTTVNAVNEQWDH